MAEPVVCPSCQKSFTPAGEVRLAWLTCPYCRAMVANPAVTSPPAANPPPVTRPSVPVPQHSMAIPALCPACEMDEGRRTQENDGADDRDGQGTRIACGQQGRNPGQQSEQ